jgi:hypothetical protein
MSSGNASETRSAGHKWLIYLTEHRQGTAYGLFLLSALAVVPAALALQHRTDYLPICLGAAVCALVALLAAVWQLGREPGQLSDLDATRALIVTVGGLWGLFISLTALAQAWHWRTVFLGGVEKWQGPDRWQIWACVAGLLVGLALSFVSLLLARTEVRANAILRRLLYGFNAVLTGMLLLAILLGAQLMLYVLQERGTIPTVYDCTQSNIYTLSTRTQNLLEKLDRPVTVYVIWPAQDGMLREVRTLLDNCRAHSDQLKVQYISPEDPAVYELRKRYQFSDRVGLLVVYGAGDSSFYDFIPSGDLFAQDRRQNPRDPKGKFLFKGETALLSRLSALTEDKPPSDHVVELLKKPGMVYALFPTNDPLAPRVRTLLDTSRSANDKLRVTCLSPDRNAGQVEDLRKRYGFKERTGVLFVAGSGPNDAHEFIPPNQLFQKMVLYFTQGNGELDLDEGDPSQPDRGIDALKRRLEAGNFEVRGLRFSQNPEAKSSDPHTVLSQRVPEGAVAVVIARPRTPLPPHAVTALREYLKPTAKDKPKGKLIVLLDVVATPDGTRMERTGLEDVLSEFGVVVGSAEVLSFTEQPQFVRVFPNDRSANPITPLFPGGLPIYKLRQLDIREPPPQNFHVDFLAGIRAGDAWLETDLRTMNLAQAGGKRTVKPVPVAIAVSEFVPDQQGGATTEPRLVVFGDATFVSDHALNSSLGDLDFGLFFSSVSWLRGRGGDIGIAPKEREFFVLPPNTSPSQLIWLPTLLMLAGIVGLGAGVWVIRRR